MPIPKTSFRTAIAIAISVLTTGGPAVGQVTERVDIGANGAQGTGGGDLPFQGNFVSDDGRFVAFQSGSPNLVPGDTNITWDVFVRDRIAGVTERVSVDSAGAQANSASGTYGISMTPDGRYVAFQSDANNLVPGDTNVCSDIFVRDRLTGSTACVSVDSTGILGNLRSRHPAISADGRFVAFDSDATNLAAGDTNGLADVFVHDRLTQATVRAGLGAGGVQGSAGSYVDSISADGRFVAFTSSASNLVVGDTNGFPDAFVTDLQLSVTERASISSNSVEGNGPSGNCALSHDGRFLCFVSFASILVASDTNGTSDIFVRDRLSGTTERVSVGTGGTEGSGASMYCWITPDGRNVAFVTGSAFDAGDVGFADIYVRDRMSDTTTAASLSSSGGFGNGNSEMPSISSNGRFVVFRSYASNLVPSDTNASGDVFIRDLFAAGFTSFCDPGVDGVLPCPCGNPPTGPGRGCNNSASTGGASISAGGVAYLSSDSLTFTTSGERPTAPSLLVQGNSQNGTGLPFGQGIRCAGGTLRRLYLKIAVGGSITAPDFGVGDLTVSARSAAVGSPIQPGQPYFYFVYYRDPIILGGCSITSGFNATQTGAVTWFP